MRFEKVDKIGVVLNRGTSTNSVRTYITEVLCGFYKTISETRLRQVSDLFVTKAIHRMVIHHTDGLHECVTNRWTDEFETPFF